MGETTGPDYDHLLKFVLVGDASTGKSSLLLRFTDGRFEAETNPTIGVEFGAKRITVGSENIKLQIWDTAGQESFRSITRSYYRGAMGLFITFDTTRRSSFENVSVWVHDAGRTLDGVPMILVGTKSDKLGERVVSADEAIEKAKTLGFRQYHECSAKTGENVDNIFTELAKMALAVKKAAADESESQLGEMGRILADGQSVLQSAGGKALLFSMLFLVGEGRAGKTGLKNALLGKVFSDTDSTIGMGQAMLEVIKEHIEANRSAWQQRDSAGYSETEEAVARILAAEIMRREEEKKAGGAKGEGGKVSGVSASVVGRESGGIEAILDAGDFEAHVSGGGEASGGAEKSGGGSTAVAVAEAQRESERQKELMGAFKIDENLVMKFKDGGNQEALKFTLWDFGGQDVFYTMHHLFLNRFGVYLVCFNMEWLVPDLAGNFVENGRTLTATERRDRTFEMINFWLRSILLHTQDPRDGSSAPVILVGTHKDKVPKPSDHESISKLLHSRFASDFPNLLYFEDGEVSTGRGLLWFYPVDNVKGLGDEALRKMMEQIESVVREEEYTRRKVPLQWLRVCDRLQTETRKSMKLAEFEEMCSECGVGGTDGGPTLAAETQLVLRFFSNLGMIMYHSEPSLRDLVVLNPAEYLIGAVTKFICNEDIHAVPEHREARKLTAQWKRLTRYAILDRTLLGVLWRDYADHAAELEVLMVKFGLVIPLITGDEAGAERSYLVPALLPRDATAKPGTGKDGSLSCVIIFAMPHAAREWAEEGCVKRERVIEDGFLPHGIFMRIVGKAVSCSQLCSNENINIADAQMSAHKVRLSFGDHSFTLWERMSENLIQVDIHVANTMVVVETLKEQVLQVIRETIPNLRAIFAVPVGGASASAAPVFLHIHGPNGLLERSSSGRKPPQAVAPYVKTSLEADFRIWRPPSGLLARYDVFLSYRWGRFDSAMADALFFALSREIRQRAQIQVFLDKQRLQGGSNFVEDFMAGMMVSAVVAPLVSVDALQRMLTPQLDARDNVLVEWTLALQLHRLKIIGALHPIMIGKIDSDSMGMENLFAFEVGGVPILKALPDVAAPLVIDEVSRFLRKQGLEPTPDLASWTIRSTVKALTDFLGTPCWDVPSSHGQSGGGGNPHSATNMVKKIQEACRAQLLKIVLSLPDEAAAPEGLSQPSKSHGTGDSTALTPTPEVPPASMRTAEDTIDAHTTAEKMVRIERERLEIEREKFNLEREREKHQLEMDRARLELERAKAELSKKSGACLIL